jgi:hypothetical protein
MACREVKELGYPHELTDGAPSRPAMHVCIGRRSGIAVSPRWLGHLVQDPLLTSRWSKPASKRTTLYPRIREAWLRSRNAGPDADGIIAYELNRNWGDGLTDTQAIEVMRQALPLLEAWMGGRMLRHDDVNLTAGRDRDPQGAQECRPAPAFCGAIPPRRCAKARRHRARLGETGPGRRKTLYCDCTSADLMKKGSQRGRNRRPGRIALPR